MAHHPLAGQLAPASALTSIPRLVAHYYTERPDPAEVEQRVQFGTSGHRGSSSRLTFNEAHVLAISQAICDVRREAGIDGPLFLGADTHALSEPARITAVEVLAANGVETYVDARDGFTATPVVSFAILEHNRRGGRADGIVITPSHNPPEDGGFKYNPPHGGPAGSEITTAIAARANALLEGGLRDVRRTAAVSDLKKKHDFTGPYVAGLAEVLDFEAIRSSGIRIGVDPMGGSGLALWDPISERYGLKLEVVNRSIDPSFRFMTLDHDGRIRMDCSSPFAMAGLVAMKDRFDVAFGNDTDYDRHGIVAPSAGLLNPNHYLAVAIDYLLRHRPEWPAELAIGKTLVSSSLIDRVVAAHGRELIEVPVGFKYFVKLLQDARIGFGGEESAGASFLRRDGTPWTTDKDGVILGLLAAEMTARLGRDPGELYRGLVETHGEPVYARVDSPATLEERMLLKRLSPDQVAASSLAGEPIRAKMTEAPHGGSIGGLKVVAENGWFAVRPSGTEDKAKVYAESFRGEDHLRQIQAEATDIVQAVFRAG